MAKIAEWDGDIVNMSTTRAIKLTAALHELRTWARFAKEFDDLGMAYLEAALVSKVSRDFEKARAKQADKKGKEDEEHDE